MLDTNLLGANYIQGSPSKRGNETFRSVRRTDGPDLEPLFHTATVEEVRAAAKAAADASEAFAMTTSERRALLLEAIADGIEALGDELLERANAETALPLARLTGERARTCGQLRLFASVVREGSWVDARIDHAIPDRPVMPKPDIRRMLVPLGPVAVFGASNFPLAFSVAGGDTASALAAGCPVVVKAHPSHPGTSELTAKAIAGALEKLDLPAGVFCMVHGGADVGRELVLCPEIEAVAFTGSEAAGRALFDLACSRPRPIPVYAEMGSVNPVFMMPGALQEKASTLGVGYADSLTLGVGQFCTNPGIVVGLDSEEFDAFLDATAARLKDAAPGTMLNEGIQSRYTAGLAAWDRNEDIVALHKGDCSDGKCRPALFTASADVFLRDPHLHEELFGPAAIAVKCSDMAQMKDVALALQGQLTATVHFNDEDTPDVRGLLPTLVKIAGRVVGNGFPTGVEVCPSMQHGGPYPASSDSRTTSVGTAAILRFARPVAFQNLPEELLPDELGEKNELGIRRLIDGIPS